MRSQAENQVNTKVSLERQLCDKKMRVVELSEPAEGSVELGTEGSNNQ